MSSKTQKGKISVSNLLNQYEKLFSKPKPQNDPPQENVSDQKFSESSQNTNLVSDNADKNSLIAFNNVDNPKISIFDAYAFNEVMRRYENSIVELTKKEIILNDYDSVVNGYEEKLNHLESQMESKSSDYNEIKEKEESLREIIDQVNVVLDEKDEKINDYMNKVAKRDAEIDKMKKELKDKEESIKNMETQLYSVLFKVSESGVLV